MKQIGKYEVLGKLGQGAMGVVYKARDPFLQRVVAVKTMSADLDSEPELRERFFREARSAGQLSHKNIITIFDLFEEDGSIYIAMEFLDGEDLKHKITRQDALPLEYKLQLMIQVCEGLDHAHLREIIHRDIKPGNIHITSSGQAKILDFGLARISSSEITKSGLVMGTPNYMSPEQVRGGRVDARSDIFSVGAVFYELLTYKKPFAASSYHATFYNILERPTHPPNKVVPALPEELSTVILRALAKEPSKRYQHVDELIVDLQQVERTLVGKRRRAQQEASKAIDKLGRLIRENKKLIREREPDAEETTARLHKELSEAVQRAELARRSDTTPGYLEIAQVRDQALEQQRRLANALGKIEAAAVAAEEPTEVLDDDAKQKRELARLVDQAKSLYRRGILQESLAALEHALKLKPDYREAATLHKKVAQRVEEQKSEEERARKAEDLFQQATAKFEEGDPEACLRLLTDVLQLEPDHLGATVLQEQAQQRNHQVALLEEQRRRVAESLETAQKALDAGDLDEARKLVEETIALDPQATGTIDLAKQIDRAEAKRKAAEELAARSSELLSQATTLEQSGQDQEALDRLNELFSLVPGHPQAQKLREKIEDRRKKVAAAMTRARSAAKSGKLEDAVGILREILGEEPAQADAQGLLERIEKEIEERQAREALEKKRDQLLTRAKQMADREDYTDAAALLERAKPELVERDTVQVALSEYRAAAKRYEEARERSRRIEEHLTRARESFDKNEWANCERELNRLLALEPEHEEALDYLERTKAKLKQSKEQELRDRQFREALGAAQVAFTAGKLDRAIAHLEKTYAIDPQNPEVQRLAKQIENRQAEIREREKKQENAKTLDAQARRLLKRGDAASARKAQAAFEEAISLWPELPGASKFQSKIEKEITRAEKREAAEARRREAAAATKDPTLRRGQTKGAGASSLARVAVAGLGVVAVAGVVWLFVSREPGSTEREPAIAPGAELSTTTADGAGLDPALEEDLARARGFLDAKDYTQAAREAESILSRWPENPVAQQILRIATDDLALITAGIQEVQGLVDAGDLEAARDSLGRVLDLAPANPELQGLLTQLNQYFKQSADRAQNQMNDSKSQASSARASSLAGSLFGQAQEIETAARDLYQEAKFGEATGKFLEASDAYARARREANRRAEQSRQASLSAQAETARQAFEQSKAEAIRAGAPNAATDLFDEAETVSAKAAAQLSAQDFRGAEASYRQAMELMNRAQAGAEQSTAAARNRMELAQRAMNVAKQGAPDDAAAQAEEARATELAAAGDFSQAATAYQSASTLYAAAGERNAIQQVLERYRVAFISRDLAALRRIWPTMRPEQAESLERTFGERLNSLQLELACEPIEVSGDSARARCRRTVSMEFSNGDKREFPSTNMFEFKKQDDNWFIDVLFGS